MGDRIGKNLFHSFKEFSVPTLGSAAFNNAGDIGNIFSRVTGNNISKLLRTLVRKPRTRIELVK